MKDKTPSGLTPQKYLNHYEGFDFDEAFTDNELEHITNAMSSYFKYASQPFGPERSVEEQAKEMDVMKIVKALQWALAELDYLNQDKQDEGISEQSRFAREELAGFLAASPKGKEGKTKEQCLKDRDVRIDRWPDTRDLIYLAMDDYAKQFSAPEPMDTSGVSFEQIEKVVSEIFYSPATNGKAEESIEKGCEAVKQLLKGKDSLGMQWQLCPKCNGKKVIEPPSAPLLSTQHFIETIEKLINKYREEELPDRNEPFHFEAEIDSGFKYFLLWLKNKNSINL